jgi:hypothetical protein
MWRRCSGNLLEDMTKTTKNLRQGSRCTDQYPKLASPEHESEALWLGQTCTINLVIVSVHYYQHLAIILLW